MFKLLFIPTESSNIAKPFTLKLSPTTVLSDILNTPFKLVLPNTLRPLDKLTFPPTLNVLLIKTLLSNWVSPFTLSEPFKFDFPEIFSPPDILVLPPILKLPFKIVSPPAVKDFPLEILKSPSIKTLSPTLSLFEIFKFPAIFTFELICIIFPSESRPVTAFPDPEPISVQSPSECLNCILFEVELYLIPKPELDETLLKFM